MENFDLYKDIAERTGGDIYIGVVGPVRAGKSAFISNFMKTLVLPHIANAHKRERAVDELPQSAAGRTIMTTQPKFIPDEGVKICLNGGAEFKVRLCDCVGYMADGARGHREDGRVRLVKTPWSDAEIPFEQAAEIGTRKVIAEHSTMGIVVTSDGTLNTEIPRSGYIRAEEKAIEELKALGKPFAVVLNSAEPRAADTVNLCGALSQKYGVPVSAVNVLNMTVDDVNGVLEGALTEFPVKLIEIELPAWMRALPFDNRIIREITERVRAAGDAMDKMRRAGEAEAYFPESADMKAGRVSGVHMGEGRVTFALEPRESLFYKILSEECGTEIADEGDLMSFARQASHAKREYEKLKTALDEVRENGYGVVSPSMEDMALEDPEIVRHGNRFGVRLKASAPSLHIMRVDIKTEVNPIVGTEQQSEELVKYLLSEFESNPKGIWDTNMFGKPLHNLVRENLWNKLHSMPGDAQKKMRKTLQRIVNEGHGGVICILL